MNLPSRIRPTDVPKLYAPNAVEKWGGRCPSSARSRSEPLIETIYLATLRDS